MRNNLIWTVLAGRVSDLMEKDVSEIEAHRMIEDLENLTHVPWVDVMFALDQIFFQHNPGGISH